MSVNITQFFGYTVTVKEDLKRDDYKKYQEFEELYPEICECEYDRATTDVETKVRLIRDGMSGSFMRFIYLISQKDDLNYWTDEDDDEKNQSLKAMPVPAEAFEELAKYYEKLTGDPLTRDQVALQEWHLWH